MVLQRGSLLVTYRKRYRLTKTSDFFQVINLPDSNKYYFPGFMICARTNGLDCPRLGLSVSKRFVGKAVQRNRIKRIIRESFICCRDMLLLMDFVVLSRPGIEKVRTETMFQKFQTYWLVFYKL